MNIDDKYAITTETRVMLRAVLIVSSRFKDWTDKFPRKSETTSLRSNIGLNCV